MAKRVVPFSFSADDERDAEVLAWLDRQPNRSAVIRDAIRAAMQAAMQATAQDQSDVAEPTLDDIYRLVWEIKRKLDSGSLGYISQAVQVAEPDEAVAALDSLAALALG